MGLCHTWCTRSAGHLVEGARRGSAACAALPWALTADGSSQRSSPPERSESTCCTSFASRAFSTISVAEHMFVSVGSSSAHVDGSRTIVAAIGATQSSGRMACTTSDDSDSWRSMRTHLLPQPVRPDQHSAPTEGARCGSALCAWPWGARLAEVHTLGRERAEHLGEVAHRGHVRRERGVHLPYEERVGFACQSR